jgi:DNA-binding response OmpR family regulator
MPASILSIGIDQELLPLRNSVLRASGLYAVKQESDLSRAVQVFMDGDFDLVVLCHSIPSEERQRIATAIKAAKPSTLVLVVRTDGEATGVADGSVHSLDGPETLLRCVEELLSRQKRS